MSDPAAADPWVVRQYDPTIDENGVVFLWLKSFARSSFGRARGARVEGSDAERAYWDEHRTYVLHLLAHADTQVLCDHDAPEVIWAFACTSGDVVHYVCVKRRFKDETDEILRALLGDRLDRACTFTHCLQGTGLRMPPSWRLNPYAVLSVGGVK